MKKILILASLVFLGSCCDKPQQKKQYDFEIITTNGDRLETSFVGTGTNLFSLKNGDLTTHGFTKTLISGVRIFRVTSIKNAGMQTKKEAEGCSCDLKQITNPE